MITNVPTSEALEDVALRLYFSAWHSLISIRADFDRTFIPGEDPTDGDQWAEEWAEYIEAYQPELQAICTVIQQSNELALKSKICEISPFLLLLKSEARFAVNPKDIDFSELRTLDAVDLPGAVNTICNVPLSEQFIQTYNEIRSIRNKISHLGQAGRRFVPEDLLNVLVFQYIELWKNRAWLQDRVTFASRTGMAFFHDGKYTSTKSEIMWELSYSFAAIGKTQFQKLFGYKKSDRRYLCHHCICDATTRFSDVVLDEAKTAFLVKPDDDRVHCIMCGEHFKVVRKQCTDDECKGNVLGNEEDEYVDKCHTCGAETS